MGRTGTCFRSRPARWVAAGSPGPYPLTKFTFLKRDVQEIRLKMQAFLNITAKRWFLIRLSLNAGGITAITWKGELRQVNSDFLYTAGLQISMLDLSAINFMKDLKMSGIVNSENLSLRGSLRKTLPSVSGDIHLEGGALRFRTSI